MRFEAITYEHFGFGGRGGQNNTNDVNQKHGQ